MSDQDDDSISAGLHDFADAVAPILAMCAGYRTKAIEAGFGPEAADSMAAEVHSILLKMALKGAV